MISQEGQSAAQDRSLLMATIQSLLNSQGYMPQQQSAITQQSLGASNTAFNALQEKAANRTVATNNSAGYDDLTTQLGREQAQTDASQARQNQVTIANQQLKEQLAGLSAPGARPTEWTRIFSAWRWVCPGNCWMRAGAHPPDPRPPASAACSDWAAAWHLCADERSRCPLRSN